jgi:hypothetical protein
MARRSQIRARWHPTAFQLSRFLLHPEFEVDIKVADCICILGPGVRDVGGCCLVCVGCRFRSVLFEGWTLTSIGGASRFIT